MSTAAIVLAAGKSTRMKSAWPKVIHAIAGRPMVDYVLDAVRGAGVTRTIAVVGHRADLVQQALAPHTDLVFVHQTEQKGTGHAVMMCREALRGHSGPVLVLAGDTPLLQAASLSKLLATMHEQRAACVIGTAETDQNQGLGRIVREPNGAFAKIVEEKDATPQQRAIREINTGCYAFDCAALLSTLDHLRPNNAQGEYYLTDVPAMLLEQGRTVVADPSFTLIEAMGVNTRVQLAEVTEVLRRQVVERLMLGGVTFVAPATSFVDPRATIGTDTVIEPGVIIRGAATIGENCTIGAYAVIEGTAQIPAGTAVAPLTRNA